MKKQKTETQKTQELPAATERVITKPRSFKGAPSKYNFHDMTVNGDNDYLFVANKTSLQMWSSINNFINRWQPKWKFNCKNKQFDPKATQAEIDAGTAAVGVMIWRVK